MRCWCLDTGEGVRERGCLDTGEGVRGCLGKGEGVRECGGCLRVGERDPERDPGRTSGLPGTWGRVMQSRYLRVYKHMHEACIITTWTYVPGRHHPPSCHSYQGDQAEYWSTDLSDPRDPVGRYHTHTTCNTY